MANLIWGDGTNTNSNRSNWYANYATGEIFRKTMPDAVEQALASYQADPNSLKARQNAFRAIRKENKDLSGKLLGNYDGYNAFANAVNQAYQPQLLGTVPGLLGNSNDFASNIGKFVMGDKRWQAMQQQQNRRIINNFMQKGSESALINRPQQQSIAGAVMQRRD